MKLALRIIPIVFVLISTTAFADTIRENLDASVGIGPNQGFGDNVAVRLFGQGVSIFAEGGTPLGFFDCCDPYFPGDQALGPTTIFWDTAGLQIGSTGYDFDQFDLFPTDLAPFPSITFPTNGKDFTVTVPGWAWELDGTIIPPTDCPSSGCNFSFLSKPGNLSFSFSFFDGAYFAGPASFTVPEPGTLALLVIGIGAVGWRKFRSSR
jgi:hypothetical protein